MTPDRPEHPVIIAAPIGQDAPMMAALLNAEGIPTHICFDLQECATRIDSETSALLCTAEALQLPQLSLLSEALKAQPSWSELPIIVLINGGEQRHAALMNLIGLTSGAIMVLERPMHRATLLNTMQVALRSRHRQYEVRDLLKEKDRILCEMERAIAERKRAEELKARLAAIVESSHDAIISKDLNGIITSWNAGAERLFGYTAQEAVGKPITMLMSRERAAEEPGILARIRRGERIDSYETIRQRKDGTPVEISLTISPIMDGSGRITGASKIARDITDRKQMESERAALLESERAARSEAERAGRLKDEFLATLSHELRTPLNAILGWSRLIDKSPTDQRVVNEGIQVITRNAQIQAELISDLLDMSRIVSGKIRLEMQNVELSMVVREAVDSLRPAAEAKQIRIQAAIGTMAEPVRGDPSRLQQVVWNLLTNAVKFTPKGGRIEVVLAKKDSHAEIQVIDTGKGIKADFLPFVFDRFRQADSSTTRAYAGLGLGLAIVKQLVELHGGRVRADSLGEGTGSTFTVELPLALTARKEELSSARHEGAALGCSQFDLNGVQVLAVDDETDARGLLKRMLEDCKADVLLASSGREGLDLLEKHSPHIVLCDIGMPEMDGYEFIRKVRQSGDRTPAVAITAFARSEDRTRALVAGYHSHIAKPVEPGELIATILAFAKSYSPSRDQG